MHQGIPPSRDRRTFERGVLLALGSCIVLALLILIMLGTGRSRLGSPSADYLLDELHQDAPMDETRQQATAYAAAKRYVLTQLDTRQVDDIDWREHVVSKGENSYRFEGKLRVKDKNDETHQLGYVVSVRSGPSGIWELANVQIMQ